MNPEQHSEDRVLDRLDDLRENSKAAERAYQYVETEHDADCSPNDLLHALRLDDQLVVETRDNGGRTVVCAFTDSAGESRYPVYEYDTLAAEFGGEIESRRIEHLRDVKRRLEHRSPRVRLRDETPLAGLEAPDEWDHSQRPERTCNGP